MTPHLHWHVIPRYADDRQFPDPVWAPARREPEPSSTGAARGAAAGTAASDPAPADAGHVIRFPRQRTDQGGHHGNKLETDAGRAGTDRPDGAHAVAHAGSQLRQRPAFSLPFEFLRVYSPSAEVRGHGPGQEVLQTGKREVTLTALEPVGNYAVQPHFSDGHNTGIYSWDYLLWLGSNQEELWEAYSAAAGSRRLDARIRARQADADHDGRPASRRQGQAGAGPAPVLTCRHPNSRAGSGERRAGACI